MDADFARQLAEGEFAHDAEGGRLRGRLLPRPGSRSSLYEALRSAQRRYMRISISAQSWLLVPPRRDAR